MIGAARPVAQIFAVEQAFEAALDAARGQEVCCNSRAEHQRSQTLHELRFHISWPHQISRRRREQRQNLRFELKESDEGSRGLIQGGGGCSASRASKKAQVAE